MTHTIDAVYTNGIFQPLRSVSEDFSDGEKVTLVVETGDENSIMELAENFYEGLSEEDIDEIERIALDRSHFFGDRHQ